MMLSKILTGGFILIMIGAVVAGAIAVFGSSQEGHAIAETRNGVRLDQGNQAEGLRGGQGRGVEAQVEGQGLGRGQGYGQGLDLDDEQGQGQGLGQGQGRGQSLGSGQGSIQRQGSGVGQETYASPQDLETVEGEVVALEDLVIETAQGESVLVGLGPSAYRESQNFAVEIGQTVRVAGYWEDDEFKATQLENLTSGQSIVLRDATGRPMWAGQGRGKNRSS
jgi:hypothetical protein